MVKAQHTIAMQSIMTTASLEKQGLSALLLKDPAGAPRLYLFCAVAFCLQSLEW